jgi:prolipoprotein diacylglyceryltransferase
MGIAFYIGTLPVRLYGIMIMLAVIMAVVLAILEARRRGETTQHVYQLALVVVPFGIIGARFYHVIDQWDLYMQNPASIIGLSGWTSLPPGLYWLNQSEDGGTSLIKNFMVILLTYYGE